MRWKQGLSLILVFGMLFSLVRPCAAYAQEELRSPESARLGTEEPLAVSWEDEQDLEEPEEPETEEPDTGTPENPEGPDEPGEGDGALSAATVSEVKAVYRPDTDKAEISFKKGPGCSYVSISIGELLIYDRFENEACIYECESLNDDDNHMVTVTPYDAKGIAGKASAAIFRIPFRPAVLEDADAEYNLERQVLIVDWYGENIAYADVYQDGELLYAEDRNKKQTDGRMILEIKLEAKSKHDYTVVAYNRNGDVGNEKKFSFEVDDYVAKIDYSDILYDDAAKQIHMTWDNGDYTEYVSIYLNDVPLVERCAQNAYVFDCVLQPGATYVVTIEPYNDKDEAGEEETEDLSYGSFDVPDDVTATLKSVEAKDGKGRYTGFSNPAVYVKWDAQRGGAYDIYRAEKNKKNEFRWYASVKAEKDGTYTFIDEKVKMGEYYYKVCQKVTKDTFVEQALFSALSAADGVKVAVPKPKIKTRLAAGGKISLTMTSSKDFVSGYDVYRRSGGEGWAKIATTTEPEYTDGDVALEQAYEYRAKAYYYDTASQVRSESKYSAPSKIKNTVGGISAQAEPVSKDMIRLSWTPAANATEYEIYHKSGTKKAVYALWKTTRRLSVKYETDKGGKHMFLIKAKHAAPSGKTYYSEAKASCTIGFCAPEGVLLKKARCKQNASTGGLEQTALISWNKVYGAQGYYVEAYDKATKKYLRVAKLKGSGSTSYSAVSAVTEQAKSVTYRISAYKGKSVKKGGTVKVTPELGTVKNVKASKSGSGVRISWKKVAGAEHYQVFRSNGRTMHLVGKAKGSSITDKGLCAEISYQYYVQAVNQTLKVQGKCSEPARYRAANTAKVKGLTAENMRAGRVDLEWNDVWDAKSYIVYFKTSAGGTYEKLAELKGKKTSYAHEGQPRGRTCYYKVVAMQSNSGGAMLESGPAHASVTITK